MKGQVQVMTENKEKDDDVSRDECMIGDALDVLHGSRAGNVKREPVLTACNEGVWDETEDVNADTGVSGRGRMVRILEESKYGGATSDRRFRCVGQNWKLWKLEDVENPAITMKVPRSHVDKVWSWESEEHKGDDVRYVSKVAIGELKEAMERQSEIKQYQIDKLIDVEGMDEEGIVV